MELHYQYLYFQARLCNGLTAYKEAVVVYIAGFVVKMVKRKVTCENCLDSLITSREEAERNPLFALLNRKRWGRLIDSSSDVITVCIETEKVFEFLIKKDGKLSTLKKGIAPFIVSTVLKRLFSRTN